MSSNASAAGQVSLYLWPAYRAVVRTPTEGRLFAITGDTPLGQPNPRGGHARSAFGASVASTAATTRPPLVQTGQKR